MKKRISIVCTCFILTLICVGCNKKSNNNDDKVLSGWKVDKDYHWHETESGKKVDKNKHSLKKDICKKCKANVSKDEYGTAVILNDEKGFPVIEMSYDSKGKLTEDKLYEYTYDKDGNKTTEKVYNSGKLYQDIKVTTEEITEKESGEKMKVSYDKEVITYNEDETKSIQIFDHTLWPIKESLYAKDGTLEYEYEYVNTFNDSGLIASVKKYENKKLLTEVKTTYDKDGNTKEEKYYKGDVLASTCIYTVVDGHNYIEKEIVISDDGKKTITCFDEDGNIISN